MEMGRYSEKRMGLDFLGSGITWACFQAIGKVQEEIEKLKIWVRTWMTSLSMGNNMLRLMLSLPTALDAMDVTLLLTSQSEN